MKLKSDFITQDIDGVQFLIPVGKSEFGGVVRSNETAAFIVNLLRNDITLEEIVDAMFNEYDAPREVLERDAKAVIAKLRSINALEE